MVFETLSNAAGNIADESEKYCPWFLKTLPIRMENIAHDFFKRCPSFWKTMGNVFWPCRRLLLKAYGHPHE